MESYYTDLARALRDRLAVINDQFLRTNDPEQHLGRLRDVSEVIDRLAADLPDDADPQLRHYLLRMSYNKALEFLESAGFVRANAGCG